MKEFEPLETEDGSPTFFSREFGEPFHSITAGAFREAIEKFCNPCRIPDRAKSGRLNLVDVCFGLGYNTAAFLEISTSVNPRIFVHIVGIEKDMDVIEHSLKLDWGRFNRWKAVIRRTLKEKSIEEGFLTLNHFSPRIKLKIFIGEARKVLKSIAHKYQNFADTIFHDPFSPKVNPEMWTYELFSLLRKMCKERGILATYSAATHVRKALHMAGFGVKEGVSVGRKAPSTVASPSFSTEEKLIGKFSLPSSVPLRDPGLKDTRELIKSRRDGCIKLIKKSCFFEQVW